MEQLATAIRLGVYPRGTTLPAERDLAERIGVSRATLREAMAALRQAGLVETTRGRGGGTVVTLKPGTPSGRAAARIADAKRQDWLDALDFRRIVEPGAAAARRAAPARRRTPGAARAGARRGGARPEAGRAPAGRLPVPPDDRRADRLAADRSRRSPRCRRRCTRCSWRSRCSSANIDHSDRQHARLVERDPGRRARPGPAGHGGALRRHGRAAARARGLSRTAYDAGDR